MRTYTIVCLVALFANSCVEPVNQAPPPAPITLSVSAITGNPDTALTRLVIEQVAERGRLNELSRQAASVAEIYAIEDTIDSLDAEFYRRRAEIDSEQTVSIGK